VSLSASGISNIDLSILIANDERKGMTVVRTLVDFDVIPSAAGAAGNLSGGIVLVDGDAFAAAAMPDPDEAQDQPGWLWRFHKGIFSSGTKMESPVFTLP